MNLHPDADFEPDDGNEEECVCDACKSGLCDAVDSGEINELEFAKAVFKQLNGDILNWLMALSYLSVHSHEIGGNPIKLTVAGVTMQVNYLPEEEQVVDAGGTTSGGIPSR